MRRTKQIFSTLQKQNKRVPSSVIDSLAGEEMQESDVAVESKVRRIIREELNGLCATLEGDPLVRAMEAVDKLDNAISGNDVNINEVKKCVKRLKLLLPDISEEMEIIRDTLVGV
jgi:hypothetical protein